MRTAAAGLGLAAAALLLGGCSSGAPSGGHSSGPSAGSDTYGTLPSYLPTASTASDSELTGSTVQPALTVEGDSVRVLVDDRPAVRITVSGPVVPGEGMPHASPAPTCTWTVTISDATRPVPISAADFSTLDHLGATYRVAYVPGRPRPPAVLRPGSHTTFELRAVMPAGEGLMRWAPAGRQVVASWDFEVEND